MRTYALRSKKPTSQHLLKVKGGAQSRSFGVPPVQAKSNEEGLAEWEAQRQKWAWLGSSWMDKVPNPSGELAQPWIQRKLTIGQPNDKYEQEADRVAIQVVKQINVPVSTQKFQESIAHQEMHNKALQEKRDCYPSQKCSLSSGLQHSLEPDDKVLQAKLNIPKREIISGGEASTDLELAVNAATGGGQPLDAELQRTMGQVMESDFCGVKIHTDAQSNRLSHLLQAKAFTTGQDIFFRHGMYQPKNTNGQELIAHELAHVIQQGAFSQIQTSKTKVPGTSLDQPLIQRKVGFELESGDWYAWKYLGNGEPKRTENSNSVSVRPAKRQVEPLHKGSKFELQADDTPGPDASNLEFVTQPFETETNDLNQLEQSLKEIEGIITTLEKFSDRRFENNELKERFIFPDEHCLNQAGFLISSVEGRKPTKFKMQATSGIRLADVPRIMQYFSKSVPNETLDETAHRDPARKMMGSNPIQDRSYGQAPIWAQEVLSRIAQKYQSKKTKLDSNSSKKEEEEEEVLQSPNPFFQKTDNLLGFLSIILAYLNNLSLKAGETLKYWQPFMARNDFASMYKEIDLAQSTIFKEDPMLLIETVVEVLNEKGRLKLSLHSPVANKAYFKKKNPNQNAIEKHVQIEVLQDLTIFRWLGVITQGGIDCLAQTNIEQFLKTMAKNSPESPESTDSEKFKNKVENHKDYLESVGINPPDKSKSGDSLFLFENRGIINAFEGGGTEVKISQTRSLAISYLMFFHKLEKVRQGNLGQFPHYSN